MKMKCKIFTVAALVTVAAAALYSQSITATKAYVDRRYADATNAVPSIVTNEVATGEWNIEVGGERFDGEVEFRLEANPLVGYGYVDVWVYVDDPGGLAKLLSALFATSNEYFSAKSQGFSRTVEEIMLHLEELAGKEATMTPVTRNALGLAMLKDLEKLPTHEDVTNTARDVVNTVWDAKLGVAWEARMHDGHLYYIAVTNAPGGAE